MMKMKKRKRDIFDILFLIRIKNYLWIIIILMMMMIILTLAQRIAVCLAAAQGSLEFFVRAKVERVSRA